jgi:hypothetical protein
MIPKHLSLVCHADWSKSEKKRWRAHASRQGDGSFQAYPPEPVESSANLIGDLRETAGSEASVLLGFDFPIGFPEAYARKAKINNFLTILPELGKGDWSEFFDVSETQEQVNIRRPFYPKKPGKAAQQHLLDGLQVDSINDLRRKCELSQPGRRAAAPLFWTLGAQQVGKAAISGWREVLQPALHNQGVSIWPFAGHLLDLLQPGKTVIVETYPAEFYRLIGNAQHIQKKNPAFIRTNLSGNNRSGSKCSQERRKADAAGILKLTHQLGISILPELLRTIQDGFGEAAAGEDAFDAVVGLIGMLYSLENWAGSEEFEGFEPGSPAIGNFEGWIFGQPFEKRFQN